MRPTLRKSAWMRDLPRRDAIEREIRRDILTNGVPYVGVFGSNGRARGETLDLGIGIRRETWLWHFAFGYVSGFPLSAIVYFLLTRCSGKRIREAVLALESRRSDYERGIH
jgi:hypothetical protein